MRLPWTLGIAAALLAAACHNLPDLGTCGNGIVEEASGEACDDPGDSSRCTASCELRCMSAEVEGYVAVATAAIPLRGDPGEAYCPGDQYRCGTDGICRAPSGAFEPLAAPLSFDVAGSPVLGDVDNDGLLDLVGAGATDIYIRFASTADEPLGDLVVQESPSSDAPYVIFNPQPAERDPMQPQLRIAIPTEGLALLRSDGERFAPELELPIAVTGETLGLVVRDPDPAADLGEVVVSVESRSSIAPEIGVTRVEVRAPDGSIIVPPRTLPGCVSAGAGSQGWRTVHIEAAADRRSFVVVTQRDDPMQPSMQPWHVCRYIHAGTWWDVEELDFAPPTPATAVLANLDADPCLELAVRGDAASAVIDAADPGCAFAPVPLSLSVPGGGPRLLGAGQIVLGGPGDLDELVLDTGVYRACTGDGDCGGLPPGTFLRVAAPTRANGSWSAATVTDLNRDGALDVVAGRTDGAGLGEPDVDVVRGGATSNVYRASTSAPIDDLVAGDFDGDRIGDVAMVETTPMGERVVVLFGTQEATVGTPRAMSTFRSQSDLRLDRFSEIRWIPSTRGTDGVDDLLVLDLRRAPTPQDPPAVGILIGDAARLMTTPRFPPPAMAGKSLGAVAAGSFADLRGGVEVLALAGDRALIYNVLGNEWVGSGIMIPPDVTLDHPIATLRDGPGKARAVARGAGDDIVVFSARGAFVSCKAAAAGQALELRGIDIDGDERDEVAIVYADGAGARSLQMFRNANPMGCSLEPVLVDELDGCVDVANAGDLLIAICRPPGVNQGPAREVFAITRAGDRFERAPAPIARVQGDGRFLTAGDYDGDGVLDIAIAVHRIDEIGVQLMRQCPAHDTRACTPLP